MVLPGSGRIQRGALFACSIRLLFRGRFFFLRKAAPMRALLHCRAFLLCSFGSDFWGINVKLRYTVANAYFVLQQQFSRSI